MCSCLVSIIIPVFNRKKLVSEMIGSIIKQTFKEWELLLIDDGSTDGALDLLCSYANVDNRIRVYSRDRLPKGAPACRNIGLKHSCGKYVVFLDSDDLLPDFTFFQRVECMEGNDQLDFAIFPSIDFFDNLNDGKHIMGINCGNDLKHLVDAHLPFTVCTNIYKYDFLHKSNITWDESLMSLQDADFNIQCILKNGKYIYASKARIDYYIRVIAGSNSISQSIRKGGHVESHLYFLDKLIKLLPTLWVKKNRWAVRRRIVFVYAWCNGASATQIAQLKRWVQNTDQVFSILFNISVCFHHLLIGVFNVNYSKAIPWAFPYYSFYNKMYGYFRKMKIKWKMISVVK